MVSQQRNQIKRHNYLLTIINVTTLPLFALLISGKVAIAQTQSSSLQQTHSSANSFVRTGSPDFFGEGRDRFEQEIEHLRQRDQLSSENLLEIAPEFLQQTQENILQLEAPDILLRESDSSHSVIHCSVAQNAC